MEVSLAQTVKLQIFCIPETHRGAMDPSGLHEPQFPTPFPFILGFIGPIHPFETAASSKHPPRSETLLQKEIFVLGHVD